jgi:hypothetical protein
MEAKVDSPWRLALMFDAPGGDVAAMAATLTTAAKALQACTQDAPIRIGVVDQHPSLAPAVGAYDVGHWRTVDGAVEIAARPDPEQLCGVAKALAAILQPIAAAGSMEAMVGPVYPMTPAREGECFLSLAFRRDLAITRGEFQEWWRRQHSQIAIPVLGPGLLAYDQVHLDPEASAAVAHACALPAVIYDAYDNLTWADRESYLASIDNPEGMARVMADEVGHIDNATRRHGIMRRLA